MQRVTSRMKAMSLAPACALACLLAASATAQSESFWTRDTLTGDWRGLRTDLTERGVLLELSSTGYYAGMLSGGVADDGFDFGGRADLLIHTDFGKLGLWDGGGFHIHAESRFGNAAERTAPRSGGLWPPNTGVVLPLGESERIVASSLYFTQSIGASATLMLGKINAVDLLASDPFFGGWARDRFTNIAFVAPPSGVVPPTIMGGILSYRIRPFSFTFMVFDPDDRTNDYWPDDLFSNGANLSLGGTWSGAIAGRASSLSLTGTYSTKTGADLSDLLLPPDIQGGTKEGSYNVALGVSHLLLESPASPGKGLGVYAKAAIADGNPNPIQASFVGGFAGHGVVPNRPNDVFGIGYYYYDLSDDLESGLSPATQIDNETGVEIFYNLAATPWFRVTADIQWIDPARAEFAHAWVGGLRANIQY